MSAAFLNQGFLLMASGYLSLFLTTLFLMYAIYSLVVLRLKNFDKGAIIVLSAYTLCMVTRTISLLVFEGD